MTYRTFINNLSDEEFAQMLIDDTLIHMACNCSVVNNTPKCPYNIQDCFKCVVKLLKSEIEDINNV